MLEEECTQMSKHRLNNVPRLKRGWARIMNPGPPSSALQEKQKLRGNYRGHKWTRIQNGHIQCFPLEPGAKKSSNDCPGCVLEVHCLSQPYNLWGNHLMLLSLICFPHQNKGATVNWEWQINGRSSQYTAQTTKLGRSLFPALPELGFKTRLTSAP
jgi:hypothetical protein